MPSVSPEWYKSTLDFEITFEYAGNYFIEAGNGALIEIIPAEGDRAESSMRSPGMRHIAIAVHDFDGARSLLASRGVAFEGEPYSVQGNRLQFFKDPDGNLLHLIQREKPMPSGPTLLEAIEGLIQMRLPAGSRRGQENSAC